MEPLDYLPRPATVTPARIWAARAIAAAADVVQVAAFPVTAEGALSPIDDGLDLIVGAAMTLLVGWHIAFVPSFVVKLLPVADLAPTWTVAVLIATAGRGGGTPQPLAPVPVLSAADPGGRRQGRAARVRATVWFAVLFAIGFVVGNAYLMPHLPPVVGHLPVGSTAPWRENWAGAVLGGGMGLVAARAVLRRAGRLR